VGGRIQLCFQRAQSNNLGRFLNLSRGEEPLFWEARRLTVLLSTDWKAYSAFVLFNLGSTSGLVNPLCEVFFLTRLKPYSAVLSNNLIRYVRFVKGQC